MRLFNSIRLAYFEEYEEEYEKDAKSKGKSGDHDYLGEWVDGEDLDGKSWTPRIPVSDTKKKGKAGSRPVMRARRPFVSDFAKNEQTCAPSEKPMQ